MALVVDASVAVEWLFEEAGADRAPNLLSLREELIAPDWVLIEALRALWKKVAAGELGTDDARGRLAALPEFFTTLHPARELVAEASDWAFRLPHSPYDCLYLALALRENCKLVTADEKFVRVLARAGLESIVQPL